MMKLCMISGSRPKELSPTHVQLLNNMSANKKKRLDCFRDTTRNQEKYNVKDFLSNTANHDKMIV